MNINSTKEKNNNVNYKPTITKNDITYQKLRKKSTFNFIPKKYYRKVINVDGNLYLKQNSMKDYNVINAINYDIHDLELENTLFDTPKDKIINKKNIRLKNNINYKNNIIFRNSINSSIKSSKTLSNVHNFDNINKNIIYKRLFNNDKNNTIDDYNKDNIIEKKLELRDFKNNKRKNYILIKNNNENDTINSNTDKKIKNYMKQGKFLIKLYKTKN